jgi:hypothetical protein
MIKLCRRHKPHNEDMGYAQWMNWVEEKKKSGQKQRQCRDCRAWLFEEEFGKPDRTPLERSE